MANQSGRTEHGSDEGELAQFDADVEEEQRERNRVLRQADFAQRACKAEPVQQAECECDHPRRAFGQSRFALASANDFRRDKHDAQRNTRLDRWSGHIHEAQRGGGERDAVRHRERRDRTDQSLPAFHQQHEREDEQQVIDAQHNVLDAEDEIGRGNLPTWRRGFHREARRVRQQARCLRHAIGAFDASEHVNLRSRQTVNANDLAIESSRALDAPAFDVGVVTEETVRLGEFFRFGRKAHMDAEPRQPERNRNYILRRQQVFIGLGTPTSRLISGKREIDIYRNGMRFEHDHVVGVSRR